MSDDWVPQIRATYQVDFEDWIDKETSGDEAWVYMIPEPLENGEDLSPLWFLLQAKDASEEEDKRFEDFWLRKAAQRGSWFAMQELASLRYEHGHLEECMRWNQRLVACLIDAATSLDQLIPPIDSDDYREILDGAIGNMAWLASEGVDTERNNPRDLGPSRNYSGQQFTYCLKCGAWKIATAPLDQCDDSVHMTTRSFG
jgi:hypothetical protein